MCLIKMFVLTTVRFAERAVREWYNHTSQNNNLRYYMLEEAKRLRAVAKSDLAQLAYKNSIFIKSR